MSSSLKRARSASKGDREPQPPPLPHFEGLTQELINAVDDPVKLKSLVGNFYRKVSSVETEYELFKSEQFRKVQAVQLENQRLKIEQEQTKAEIERLKTEELQRKLEIERLKGEKEEAESQREVFKEEFFKSMYGALEQDFTCSICSELFIQPAVLECGHTYCHHCINKWNNENNSECPICREFICSSSLTKQIGMESYINKIHTMLSPDIRNQRDQVLRDREIEQLANPIRSTIRSVSPRASSSSSDSDDSNEVVIDGGTDGNDSDEDSLSDVPLQIRMSMRDPLPQDPTQSTSPTTTPSITDENLRRRISLLNAHVASMYAVRAALLSSGSIPGGAVTAGSGPSRGVVGSRNIARRGGATMQGTYYEQLMSGGRGLSGRPRRGAVSLRGSNSAVSIRGSNSSTRPETSRLEQLRLELENESLELD